MAKRRRKRSSSGKKRTLSSEQLEKMRLGRERAKKARENAKKMEGRVETLMDKGLPSEVPKSQYERMLDEVRRKGR